jgi:hypothetical protein
MTGSKRLGILILACGLVALRTQAAPPRVVPIKAVAGEIEPMAACTVIEATRGLLPYYRLRGAEGTVVAAAKYEVIGGMACIATTAVMAGIPALQHTAATEAVASSFEDLAGTGRLGLVSGVPYWQMSDSVAVPLVAHAMEPLKAWREARPVFDTFHGMALIDRVLLDRFMTPEVLWTYGPLGMLGAEANAAAERGAWERYEELAARFWDMYRAATARRAALGMGRSMGRRR